MAGRLTLLSGTNVDGPGKQDAGQGGVHGVERTADVWTRPEDAEREHGFALDRPVAHGTIQITGMCDGQPRGLYELGQALTAIAVDMPHIIIQVEDG